MMRSAAVDCVSAVRSQRRCSLPSTSQKGESCGFTQQSSSSVHNVMQERFE
jgi:hypothetical protein